MKVSSYTCDYAGKTLTAEFTDLTEQANGSVLLTLGETTILVTATMSDRPTTHAYFPLSVEFEEKFYAAGAILGSRYGRREGRPSDEAILSARIVDRTIRPLFDHSLRHDIQIVVTVLAMGQDDPDVLAVIGTSLALGTSDIPWNGPVSAVRIGRRITDGEIIINPQYTERADDQLAFEVLACGQGGTLNMIEAAATEVSEPDLLAVLEASIALQTKIETWQQDIIADIGKPKREFTSTELPAVVAELFANEYQAKLTDVIYSGRPGKNHLYEIKHEFVAAVAAQHSSVPEHVVGEWFETKIDQILHVGAIQRGERADGRALTAVRPLYAKAGGISPALHGSGIFYRGGTHIFSALTLAGPDAAQLLDTIEDRDTKKRFMHHYNFPPFSVGDTGRIGGFNRRMIGHGALAEKALRPVIPDQATFPYTIRLVSETLASNGSSSMGSVCAATLALLDGGVPITKPVAGIALGVMVDGDAYAILTDIQGPEDEFGDMDLKVAGTVNGITAVQMDVKVVGIPIVILREALEQARQARLQILDTMRAEITGPRPAISARAPHITTLTINPEQIGLVIGSGGKTINRLKEQYEVDEITIEDSGQIFITGPAGKGELAKTAITAMTKTYQIGDTATVEITKLTNFGAFARLDPYHEGLIHVSEIAPFHIEDPADVLTEGEIVNVVVSRVDGEKIGLSIKEIDSAFATRKGITPPTPVKN